MVDLSNSQAYIKRIIHKIYFTGVVLVFSMNIQAQENSEVVSGDGLEYNSKGNMVFAMQDPWFSMEYLQAYDDLTEIGKDWHNESFVIGFDRFVGDRISVGLAAALMNQTIRSRQNVTSLILEPKLGFAVPLPGSDPVLSLAYSRIMILDDDVEGATSALTAALSYPVFIQSREWAWVAEISRAKTFDSTSTFAEPLRDFFSFNIGQQKVSFQEQDEEAGSNPFKEGTVLISGQSGLIFIDSWKDDQFVDNSSWGGDDSYEDVKYRFIDLRAKGGYFVSKSLAMTLDARYTFARDDIEDVQSDVGSYIQEVQQFSYAFGLRLHPFAGGLFIGGQIGNFSRVNKRKGASGHDRLEWDPSLNYALDLGYSIPVLSSVHFIPSFSYGTWTPAASHYFSRNYTHDKGLRMNFGLSTYIDRN